jgi:hypothetical protein
MMQILNHIKVVLLITLTTSGAWGQQVLREIEFTVYGQYPVRNVNYIPMSEETLQAKEQPPDPVSIKTHSLARMGPYNYKGTSRLKFYDALNNNLVARVNIPNDSKKWLLIFVKNPRFKSNPDKNLKYLIYPFNDSLRNLPKNSLVFLNISGKELDGLLEDKRVALSAGESEAYRVQESLPVNLWAHGFNGKELLPALIKTYRFEPDHRYLIILFPPVLTGSVDLDIRLLAETQE